MSDAADRFVVEERLGAGASGTVWRARDRASGQLVALKLLTDPSPARVERFRREAELTASLAHVGIVRVHAAGLLAGRPFIAYELVEGARTLDQLLPGLPVRRRVELVRDVARALGHAHARGVVHRDVKPENILVDQDGRARVADFGLALGADVERLTLSGVAVGTPRAMAPEQVGAERAAQGPPTDVWALGVLLYEALAERPPFEGTTLLELASAIARDAPPAPSRVRAGAPASLDGLVLRCLAKEPGGRPADGDALADDLDRWLAGGATSAAPRRARTAAVAVPAAAMAVVLAVGLFYRPARPPSPRRPPLEVGRPVAAPPGGSTPAGPAARSPPPAAPSRSPSVAALAADPLAKGFVAEAEAGNPAAMAIVARMLESGTGAPQDHAEAERWYARSARAGHDEGMLAYGRVLLDRGEWREALGWLERAGAAGNDSALRLLGATLRDGRTGAPVDLDQAVEHLEAALRAGNGDAPLDLARARRAHAAPADLPRARTLLEECVAREPDHDLATYFLAVDLLERGPPPPDRALALLERSAAAGHGEAMRLLGELHAAGAHGLRADAAVARRWWGRALDACLRLAREKGSVDAMRGAADLIERGKGCARDPAAAAWWRARAAGAPPGPEPRLQRDP